VTVRVRDTDKGFKALMKALGSQKAAYVVVGIRQEKGHLRERRGDKLTKRGRQYAKRRREAVADPKALSLVQIAAINEFGGGNVPERSYLRSTFDEKARVYRRRLTRGLEQAVDAAIVRNGKGTMTATLERALQTLGTQVARDVQMKVRDLRDPPNAAITIERKGSSNPLVDTGRLRGSIDWEIRPQRPS
jgi:hypothetical protein